MSASSKVMLFALPTGLVLPAAPKPAGAYRPAVISDDLIILSGFGPRDAEGRPIAGMIHAVPDFTQHPQVIDGCSELLHEVFGERGQHARMAFGVASLPFGAPVAIDCICQIEV